MRPIIQITRIFKKYNHADACSLCDFSLSIGEGQIFGLIGPNGAGKTTLISILCGLIEPTSGDYTINEMNYRSHAVEIRRITGIVPQEYALYPTLTAKENLRFFGSMYGLRGAALENEICSGLRSMGLARFGDNLLGTFSGGMKRRINLLAGVLHKPRVLFLDEPTVGADVQSRKAILAYLREFNKEGTTIVYTSHHLSEAEDFCNQIAIIDHGKVYATGTPAELIADIPEARNLEDVFISLTGQSLRDAV
ncbi:MAG: ABC transporter ATP-binding protein [Chitinophagaceae bacterium]|nr:MAG: ABC transporter ATP-binding protein [Chitinophagaceae bacterium]